MTGLFFLGSEKIPDIVPVLKEQFIDGINGIGGKARVGNLEEMSEHYAKVYVSRALSIAEKIAQHIDNGSYDVNEVACGYGLPSLALASILPENSYSAFDADLRYLVINAMLKAILAPSGVNFENDSFYSWKNEHSAPIGKKSFLIADQAKSDDGNSTLERNILRYAVQNKFSIAIVPYVSDPIDENSRADLYIQVLQSAGYEVNAYFLQGIVPQKLIIGTI